MPGSYPASISTIHRWRPEGWTILRCNAPIRNYTVLWNPNLDPRNATFGFANQDRNNPRDIRIGARFTF